MKIRDTVHFRWYRNLLTLGMTVFLLAASIATVKPDFGQFFGNMGQVLVFLRKLANPDFKYLPKLVSPMIKTLKMSALGTMAGVFAAIPFSFLATTIVTDNPALTSVIRLLMNIIRTIPNLLLAALLVAIIGIGEATGVVTIAIFTFGAVSQLIYESIETIDLAPLESAAAVGANKLKVAVWAVWPQIAASVASYTFYAFELNVRASTVLGYVGAGGIGVKLNEALGLFKYERVSIIILFIFVVVVIVDTISEMIRRRLR